VTLHTTDAVPLPTTLGALTASQASIKDIDVTTSSGSCYAPITAAVADLSLSLSPEATPWQKALIVTTMVDGAAWQRTTNTIYAQCASTDPDADKGLAEGTYSVTKRATLPGTDLAIETAPISVTLSCSPKDIVDPPKQEADPDVAASGCAIGDGPTTNGFGAWIAAAGAMFAAAMRGRARRRLS
jgi:hypothetical protein